MDTYPSITKKIHTGKFYAYDKIDGSNIRVEWTRKKSFHKYGTRTRLLDSSEQPLGEAIDLFQKQYSKILEPIMIKQQWEKATLFLEFHGKNSFAGHHQDEPHQLTLIDVKVHRKGFLHPKDFERIFENTPKAKLIHQGDITQDFIEQVKNGKLEGMTFEGVVCKGGLDQRGRPVNFKIKNQQWLNKLKEYCSGDPELYEKLN